MTDAAGRQWLLPQPTAWRMEYTAGIPCDSFWMRCPWEAGSGTRPGDWPRFWAEHEGERVFTGVVDECQVEQSGGGSVLELSGRGMAALLLDNEALGEDYGAATMEDILRDHVRPYGIQTAAGANLPPVSPFSVATGSSEWSVVYDFARYYGGVAPRFDREGRLVLTAPSGLHGAEITLRFPSVGATETLLLAAACAKGRTILRGAAREPEIADLAAFLNRCGGCIEGAGSSTIRIEGRRGLSGCCFSPLPDRIFASTLACGCAAAGGRVELTGCAPALYAPVLEILGQMGCRVEPAGDTVRISRFGRLHGAGRVFTGAYPALATDAAPLLAAAMLCADSESSIEDVIFERRFGCAEGFCRLGAQAETAGRVLTIAPGGILRGTVVEAPDLRGGAALVLAGLAARGTTVITHPAHIDRGYAGFTEILAGLGAQIRRESPTGNGSAKKTSVKKQICLAIGAKR